MKIRIDRRWLGAGLLLGGLLWGATPAASQDKKGGAEAQEEGGLKGKLDRLLRSKELAKSEIGVHVVDLATGETVYERGADKPMNPASNMKIVTTAAVLDRFGPDFTYTTELYGGAPRDGVISGELTLTGNGDPFLEWSHVLELAERVRRRGVKVIDGDLVVDDTAFDAQVLPPSFDQKNEDATYRSTISALAANFSFVTVIIRPTKAGSKPAVSFDPPGDYAIVENDAATVATEAEAKKKPLVLDGVKDGERTRFKLSGTTASGATVRKRIHQPSMFTGYLLKEALATMGVEVQGTVRRGERGKGGELLARHSSYTLPYLIAAMEKWSNNFMAEMLFKSLDLGDDPATFAGAAEATRAFLKKAGVKGEVKVTNGSGLYDANLLSARQLTQLLTYLERRPDIQPEFETSLAIAGVDGTLGKRLKGLPAGVTVRAKTGTLNNVSSLTGYLSTAGGQRLGFSLLFKGAGTWKFRQTQDAVIEALAAE